MSLRSTFRNHRHIQPVSRQVCATGSYPITSCPDENHQILQGNLSTLNFHKAFRIFSLKFHHFTYKMLKVIAFCYSYLDPYLILCLSTISQQTSLVALPYLCRLPQRHSPRIRLTLLTLSFYCGSDRTVFLTRITLAHTPRTILFISGILHLAMQAFDHPPKLSFWLGYSYP